MRIKKGVSIRGIRPEIAIANQIIKSILEDKYGVEFVITAGTDGSHSRGSLHYVGLAEDFRNREVEKHKLQPITIEMSEALGDEFDVVLEKTHWHVEFQPKTPV